MWALSIVLTSVVWLSAPSVSIKAYSGNIFEDEMHSTYSAVWRNSPAYGEAHDGHFFHYYSSMDRARIRGEGVGNAADNIDGQGCQRITSGDARDGRRSNFSKRTRQFWQIAISKDCCPERGWLGDSLQAECLHCPDWDRPVFNGHQPSIDGDIGCRGISYVYSLEPHTNLCTVICECKGIGWIDVASHPRPLAGNQCSPTDAGLFPRIRGCDARSDGRYEYQDNISDRPIALASSIHGRSLCGFGRPDLLTQIVIAFAWLLIGITQAYGWGIVSQSPRLGVAVIAGSFGLLVMILPIMQC